MRRAAADADSPQADDTPMPDEGRRERKRRQTLDLLASTAFRLFETRGYDAVTMEQIAVEADVAKGTLYNHFPVKEALLAHQFHGELAAGVAPLRAAMRELPDFASRMTYLLHASADWSQAHRAYLPHYFRFRFSHAAYGDGGQAAPPRSGLDRLFETLIRDAQQTGELRADAEADHLAHLFQYLYLGALTRWLALPDSDLRQGFDVVLDLFLRGYRAPAGKKR